MMRMIGIIRLPILLVFILLSGCASTKITAVWRDPSYSEQPHKALVILATGRPIIKRVFEDEFARQLTAGGIEAVPGYSLLPPEEKADKEQISSAVEKIQADTLFITRLVDKKNYETYYPGSVYVTGPPLGRGARDWGGFYSRGFTTVQATPGYTVQQAVLYVETQLYDVKSEQLIWSVMTETESGDSPESEVKTFVKVIMESLAEKGLVQKR